MTMTGTVAPGDTAKLVALMQRRPEDTWSALGRIELNIAGGDTREALLLAETLVGLYPHMVTAGNCAGACAIVWLAGAWRVLPKGKIGLEKPQPFVPAAGTARAADAPPTYDPLPDQLRGYLAKQGVPLLLVEQVLASGVGTVSWLSEKDINTTGVWPPYYYEKLRANCPLLLENSEAFHALRRCAARLVVSQKAFALDRLLNGVNDPWWNENRELFKNAPR
ncbi:MAG: hypothetical protein H0W47_16855 [Polaromonas sp.]|uniref:hypothetical protein n=1 Tax=Polaromonas sp. TaxID=1869339 RepID=UPI0017ADC4A3|nr:hypothetical protein [Polaromonas sp.]MBA3595437.1 hypothetical protein [Polaromonas sp.]